MPEEKKFKRLPTYVKPQVYHLFLKPDLNTFSFDGKETVEVQILQPTDKIVLYSFNLVIQNVSLVIKPGDKTLIPVFSLSVEEETLILKFSEIIPVGNALLTIEFTGELNEKMVGFYRSKYLKVAGEEDKYFAVSQFEPTHARRCFPCWDEPVIKAEFEVTLSIDANKTALSNMPVECESRNEEGQKIVKFLRTPRMSTYLLALVVGDFEYVETVSSDGVLIRVYTPLGKKEQGTFALHVAAKILPYYKDYFQIAYPLPKIDLVAVSEMSCGAMENWGLVTYRETYLLVDEKNTSALTKQTVAIVVGHELAHQWFGNLVTMEWWTHLWLNEGYASFVEYMCVEYVFPEYDIWTQFVSSIYCTALELDALENSHPIEVPINHPAEIDEIFDNISYNKGASIIRMLHRYIGDDDFRKGMNLYLTRHQYSNTFTEDLWAALEEASSKPIKTIMPTWTKQVGFPVITVESSTQEGNSRKLILTQAKFSCETSEKGNDTLWKVPLSFCTKLNSEEQCFTTIMETRQCEITIPNVAADDWVKLNPGTVGFYRTRYPSELLQQFIPSMKDKSLPPLDRLGILDDLFALIQAGHESTVQALDLIYAMKDEDNYTVWSNISTCMEKIHNLLINANYINLFDAYGLEVIKPIYNKLGYEKRPDESHLCTLLRSLVLNRLVKYGDKDFAEIARKKFEEHCSGVQIIPADLRSVVYKAVMSVNGQTALKTLINLYKASDQEEEKDRILVSFSAITDESIIDDVLKFTQSDDINPPSAVIAINSIASSKVGRQKTFEFMKENYDKIFERYKGGFLLGQIIKYTTENFASEEKACEIEAFFADKNLSGYERIVQQSLETIRNNTAWLKRDGKSIVDYLEKF